MRFLLRTIREHNEQNLLIGRKKLALLSGATSFKVSEQQARRVLTGLSAKGLVQMNRGRAGLRLTDAGLARAGGR